MLTVTAVRVSLHSAELRRPYKAPTTSQALTIQTAFRSSDPMHPVSRKAVLTTTVGRLVAATGSKLSSKEAQHKLKAIAGPRYDPGSNTLKISSDSYPTVTMNMKWCSDALDRLIEAAAVRFPLHSSMRDLQADWLSHPGHIRSHDGHPADDKARASEAEQECAQAEGNDSRHTEGVARRVDVRKEPK